jgi:tRNA A37 threonylcarbamoyladenosine synthetase subunit TsaC/SUA5/YrdC
VTRFLREELALGFAFAKIAFQSYETGNQESARQSITAAEKAYEKVGQCLLDRERSSQLTESEIRDLTTELEALRKKLEMLEQFRK